MDRHGHPSTLLRFGHVHRNSAQATSMTATAMAAPTYTKSLGRRVLVRCGLKPMASVSSRGPCVPTLCLPLQSCLSQPPAPDRLRPCPGRIPGRPTRSWLRGAGSGPGPVLRVMPPMDREVVDRPYGRSCNGSPIQETRWRWLPTDAGACRRLAVAIRTPRSLPSSATPARSSGRLSNQPGLSTSPVGPPCRAPRGMPGFWLEPPVGNPCLIAVAAP